MFDPVFNADASTGPRSFFLATATDADRTYLARLNYLTDVFGDESQEPNDHFEQDYRKYIKDWTPEQGGIIAWEDKLIPAGGLWFRYWEGEDRGYGFYAEDVPELAIAVEKRYQNYGLGSRLIQAGIALAKHQQAPGVSLSVAGDNERAAHVYRKYGFHKVAEHDAGGHAYAVMFHDFC